MLAVTVSVSPQGEVSFIGDGQADVLEMYVEAGLLKFTGAAPSLAIPASSVSSLTIDLGGGADAVYFGRKPVGAGDADPILFNDAALSVTNTEWTEFRCSMFTGGDQSYSGNVYIAASAIALTSGGDISFASGVNAVPNYDGQQFLEWQRNLGTSSTSFRSGDMNGDGNVDGGDLNVWRSQSDAAPPVALTLNASEQVRLLGPVGDVESLTSLTVDAINGVILGAGPFVLNGNSTTFNSPVVLTGDLVINDAGNVTFNDTVQTDGSGNWDLTVNCGGATTFKGAVGGGFVPLGDLTTDAAGSTVLGANVTTVGVQTYIDPVTLANTAANVVVTGLHVRFFSTLRSQVDGFSALTVNASGDTLFAGAVGLPPNRLKSVSTNAAGQTLLGAAAGAIAISTTEDQFYGDPVLLLNHVSVKARDASFASTVNSGVGGPWDLNVDAARMASFGATVGGVAPLRDWIVSTGSAGFGGPLTIGVPTTVTRDIVVQVRESTAASASDDLTLTPGAQLSAGRNVALCAGDDIAVNSGATIGATGELAVQGDFGDNDTFFTTITTGPTTNAVGMLRGIAGISISGGNQGDVIYLQAERLLTPNVATISGLLGDDQFTLVFATNGALNSLLNVGSMNILGETTMPSPELPNAAAVGTDRLTIDHTFDPMRRVVTAAYQTLYQGAPTEPTTIDGSNASFIGYGASAFNVTGMEKYRLQASSTGHDHINIVARDQTSVDAKLEQQVFVSADASRQWELAGWESGHLAGSNVRDAILNDTPIPMLLEGRAGNDTIVGGNDPSSVDVIFGGAGAPFSRVGQLDSLLSDASLFLPGAIPLPEQSVRMGDYLIARAGNDFLFSDIDLFRNGPALSGLIISDQPGEADVIDGGTPGIALGAEVNHGAHYGGNDIVRNINGSLIEGHMAMEVPGWILNIAETIHAATGKFIEAGSLQEVQAWLQGIGGTVQKFLDELRQAGVGDVAATWLEDLAGKAQTVFQRIAQHGSTGEVLIELRNAAEIIHAATGKLLEDTTPENTLTWLRGMADVTKKVFDRLAIEDEALVKVFAWLRGVIDVSPPDQEMFSEELNLLIDAAFRSNSPSTGKNGLLSPPYNAVLDDFKIQTLTLPVAAAQEPELVQVVSIVGQGPTYPPAEASHHGGEGVDPKQLLAISDESEAFDYLLDEFDAALESWA